MSSGDLASSKSMLLPLLISDKSVSSGDSGFQKSGLFGCWCTMRVSLLATPGLACRHAFVKSHHGGVVGCEG